MTSFPWHHKHSGHPPAVATPKPAAGPFWQVLGLGLITFVFGVAVLAWPSHTLQLLGALVGIWLLVAGAIRLAGAFAQDLPTGRRLLLGGVGAVLVVGGIACIRHVATGVGMGAGAGRGAAIGATGLPFTAAGLSRRPRLRRVRTRISTTISTMTGIRRIRDGRMAVDTTGDPSSGGRCPRPSKHPDATVPSREGLVRVTARPPGRSGAAGTRTPPRRRRSAER